MLMFSKAVSGMQTEDRSKSPVTNLPVVIMEEGGDEGWDLVPDPTLGDMRL